MLPAQKCSASSEPSALSLSLTYSGDSAHQRVRLWALLAKAPLAAANRQSIPHRLERWRSTSLSYGELMPAYSTILRTMRLRVFFIETQDVHSISRISSPRP